MTITCGDAECVRDDIDLVRDSLEPEIELEGGDFPFEIPMKCAMIICTVLNIYNIYKVCIAQRHAARLSGNEIKFMVAILVRQLSPPEAV